jgi:hypothetical protein
MHRDALVHLFALRGNGDVQVGWQSTGYFTRKASQWYAALLKALRNVFADFLARCEIMVAAQLAEIPKLPHQTQGLSLRPVPEAVIVTTDALTATTLNSLPHLSAAFVEVIRYLHQAAVLSASPPPDTKIDDYIIQPTYDAQHALLKILAAQKLPDHEFTDMEVLLAEVFQLYYWTGTRGLPPQTKLCELLVSRVTKALLPLLLEGSTGLPLTTGHGMAAEAGDKHNSVQTQPEAKEHFYCFLTHTKEANNAITWALALCTLVTAPLLAPEHHWFKVHFQLQLRAMALHKDQTHWLAFLSLFPTTDGFTNSWIDLRSVWREHGI